MGGATSEGVGDALFPVAFQRTELNNYSPREQNRKTDSGLLPVSDRLPVAEPDCSILSPPDWGQGGDGLCRSG